MVKVSELEGALLDLWVARALGDRLVRLLRADGDRIRADRCEARFGEQWDWNTFAPSRGWMDGGPIIEREKISIERVGDDATGDRTAYAYTIEAPLDGQHADTALVAAMRAYVASKYGEEVPDEQEPA